MSENTQGFDAFNVRLNKSASREKAVDDALKLLESQYLTSDDATREIEHMQDTSGKRFRDISRQIKKQKSSSKNREEVLDEVLFLLENARLNSDDARRVKRKYTLLYAALSMTAGIALIILAGFLIVVDPPAWLKGPTVFYFNVNDGITISDIISVLMIGFGTFMLFLSSAEINKGR